MGRHLNATYDMVLRHLQEFDSLTPAEALAMDPPVKCLRATIRYLRQQGCDIKTIPILLADGRRSARYTLVATELTAEVAPKRCMRCNCVLRSTQRRTMCDPCQRALFQTGHLNHAITAYEKTGGALTLYDIEQREGE